MIGQRRQTSVGRQRVRRRVAVSAAVAGAALALAACGTDTQPDPGLSPPSEDTSTATPLRAERRVTVDGTQRRYDVVMPAGDEAVPAVIALHDAGNTIDGIKEATQLDRAALQHGFAAVFPAAVAQAERTWNAGFCCGVGPSVGVDDMAFLEALVDELASDERIDGERIHLAGVSNGAVMAYHYACRHPEHIAGVGSVAGTMNPDTCEPSAPVPVLEIHGTADQVVPFDGGAMPEFVMATRPAMGAEALTRRWAELNDCAGQPATTGEAPVSRTVWDRCDNGASVQLIAVDEGGHTWYAPGFGPVQGAVDATAEIVSFFGLAG